MKMKGKLLMVGLVLIAILSAGCLNLTVYDTYEEVTPTAIDYSGTVDDYTLMDGGSGGSGRFPSGTYGQVTFSNTNDIVTKTATSGSFNVIMDYYDANNHDYGGLNYYRGPVSWGLVGKKIDREELFNEILNGKEFSDLQSKFRVSLGTLRKRNQISIT